MNNKTGFKTSEFWVTLIPLVVSLLITTGVISPADATQTTEMVTEVVAGIIAGVSLVSYIVSRTSLKKEELRMNTYLQKVELG